jgi:hypothetical protein
MLHPRIVLQAILSGGQRDLNLVTGGTPRGERQDAYGRGEFVICFVSKLT